MILSDEEREDFREAATRLNVSTEQVELILEQQEHGQITAKARIHGLRAEAATHARKIAEIFDNHKPELSAIWYRGRIFIASRDLRKIVRINIIPESAVEWVEGRKIAIPYRDGQRDPMVIPETEIEMIEG